MNIEQVRAVVGNLCCMTFEQASAMRKVILDNGARQILELGFDRGVSTCYMAAVVDELGHGHITTIDLASARVARPNIEDLLARLGLEKYVTAHFEPTSYLWRLMCLLEQEVPPRFDLCYLDGAHDWYTDGFAFLLVDRLLKPGGVIVFDDLDWTFDTSPSLKATERVARMPADERATPQVRKVYELLVKRHPAYADFVERDGWAFARKIDDGAQVAPPVRREVVYDTKEIGIGAALLKIARRIAR